jgi:hypothetical protein
MVSRRGSLAGMLVAVGALAVGGPLPCTIAGDTGHVFVGAVDPPKTTANDVIQIRYLVSGSSDVKTLAIPVGISKGWGSADKAKCIADTINGTKTPNPASADLFRAAYLGNTVSLVGQDGTAIVSVGMNENSKQSNVTWTRMPGPKPKNGGSKGTGPGGPMRSVIAFSGDLTGLDPDGDDSTVSVGTKHGTVTLSAGDYPTTEAMVRDLMAELTRKGLVVTPLSDLSFRIDMLRRDGDQLSFCCTDEGCSIEASLGEFE